MNSVEQVEEKIGLNKLAKKNPDLIKKENNDAWFIKKGENWEPLLDEDKLGLITALASEEEEILPDSTLNKVITTFKNLYFPSFEEKALQELKFSVRNYFVHEYQYPKGNLSSLWDEIEHIGLIGSDLQLIGREDNIIRLKALTKKAFSDRYFYSYVLASILFPNCELTLKQNISVQSSFSTENIKEFSFVLRSYTLNKEFEGKIVITI